MMSIRDGALEEKWARFEDFATNLLLFHDNTSSLGEFRLSSRIYNQRHVDQWIRRGIEYCPSVLKILILNFPRFKFPPIVGSNFCHLKTLHLAKWIWVAISRACSVLTALSWKIWSLPAVTFLAILLKALHHPH